jgi:hypothetical protein
VSSPRRLSQALDFINHRFELPRTASGPASLLSKMDGEKTFVLKEQHFTAL